MITLVVFVGFLAAAEASSSSAPATSAVDLLLHPELLPWEIDPKSAIDRFRELGASSCEVDDPVLLRLGEAETTAVTKGAGLKCSLTDATWTTRYRWTSAKPAQAFLQDHVVVFLNKTACQKAERSLSATPFTSAPRSGPKYRTRTFVLGEKSRTLLVNPTCDRKEMTLTLER